MMALRSKWPPAGKRVGVSAYRRLPGVIGFVEICWSL